MHKKKSKLRERTQLVFIYGLMIVSIGAILAVLLLVIQGYRYNRYDGKIEQGGLVQFDSTPDGATVAVDGIQLANKTASKITLTSGAHTITMNRSGYNEWKKSVTVKPGSILWLNYSRLFPTNPKRSIVTQYTTVSSSVQSPDQNWLAVVANPANAEVSLVRLDTDTPAISQIAILATNYTAAADPTTQIFTVLSWDKDSQSVLVRHEYDGKSEYIVLNIRGDGTAYNVTSRLGVAAAKVQFSENDSKVLYILNDAKELRRANISSTTLSGPLASNISDFTAVNQDIVTYETFADANGQRSVGYVSAGKDTAKQIASYILPDTAALHVRAGKYYGDRYVVIAHDTTVDILKGSLPASDSNDTLSMSTVKKLTNTTASYAGFSPEDNRMVYVQDGATAVTYDLELGTAATLTFPVAPSTAMKWIDQFHVATSAGGTATYYDYDGTNSQTVATGVVELPISLSSNDKYIYYFVTNDDGSVSLSRVQMIE